MDSADDEAKAKKEERAKRIEELRKRYLEGTIDDVLIPDDADISDLMEELDRTPDPDDDATDGAPAA